MNSTMSLPLPSAAPSPGATAFPPQLTSTTAPGKVFASRSELQEHYKSDWHRYNLKRREAGLSMLNERDFALRLEAAVALRKEREGREERSGVDHRKDKSGGKKKKDKKQKKKDNRRKPAFAKREESLSLDEDIVREDGGEQEADVSMQEELGETSEDEMDDGPPEINPSQCFFDNHTSPSPRANLAYMRSKYSFFLPDAEFLVDLEGFLGYCNEKVRWGNLCLCCQKSFSGTEAVLKHMRDKRHCKILYERGVDMEEYDVFYDFSRQNDGMKGENVDAMQEEVEDDGEWEDVDDEDEEGEWEDASMNGEEDDLYDAYQSELASRSIEITPLGELVFPDGRIVGHRGLARYYKQRFAPDRMERAAVRHAREAAGDRLCRGRVVNLYQLSDGREGGNGGTEGETSTALATMGRMAGSVPTGRNGKGILVSGGGGFTSLSLYRYRAAVKKQRREDARGQRLQYRSQMNMNKMDKKGNNKMTGVVTALAPR